MSKPVRRPAKREILQLLERAIDHLDLGVTITNLDGKILYTNQAEARMHGYEITDLIGQDARIFAPRDTWKGITTNQARELGSWQRESVNIRKDGTVFPVQITSDVISNEAGDPEAVITICEDLTEKRSSYAAYYDTLTGLPNRRLFMDRLGRSVKRTKRRSDYLFALLYIDLDHFKSVNDSAGRDVADRLLVACARRIEASLRFGDTVAHLDGDEFLVLLEDIRTINDALFVADRIQQHLGLPFNINDQDLYITGSIGIAEGASGYDRPEDILRDANAAMYRAKVLGRGRYELFDDTILNRAMALLPLELSLKRAMENQELQLVYEPFYSVSSGKLLGCEASLQWHHPERGVVSPEEFVNVAEESGILSDVCGWMLRTAITQTKNWRESSHDLILSVPVMASELTRKSWLRTVSSIAAQTGMDLSSLEIQLSEHAIIRNTERLRGVLEEVHKKGIKICISEYGSSHSSLENLRRYQIQRLKLDRGFLRDIIHNHMDQSVATAMIVLAHNMKIRVSADYIENNEQLDFLKWHRFDVAQGPVFHPPMQAEEFEKLLISP